MTWQVVGEGGGGLRLLNHLRIIGRMLPSFPGVIRCFSVLPGATGEQAVSSQTIRPCREKKPSKVSPAQGVLQNALAESLPLYQFLHSLLVCVEPRLAGGV